MTFPRFTSPSVSFRLFDPMPLPRKTASVRRARIEIKKLGAGPGPSENKGPTSGNKSTQNKFKYKVKKIPVNA